MAIKKKTLKDVKKLLDPLYKDGKHFVISESDYKWVSKIIPPNGYGIVRYRFEDVYFDTLKTETKPKNIKCIGCKKTDGLVKFYILPDTEEVKPLHPKCFRKLIDKKT